MMDFFRKRPLIGIIFSLFLTVSVLLVYSFSEQKFTVMGMELKTPGFKEFLFPAPAPLAKVYKSKVRTDTMAATAVAATAKVPQRVTDTSAQRILMIGESMTEGIYLRFLKYAKLNKHNISLKVWYGSSLPMWCRNDTFQKVLQAYKPTLVFVSIGSNELFIPHIRSHEHYLTQILDWLSDYKYIWIGPPNWKDDTGIGDMLTEHIPADQYFISKNLTFNRRKDGAHPTQESANMWADTLAKWVMVKSAFPIKMDNPDLVKPKPKTAADSLMAAKAALKPVKKAPAKKADSATAKAVRKQEKKKLPSTNS